MTDPRPGPSDPSALLRWQDDHTLGIDGVDFFVTFAQGDYSRRSQGRSFLLLKAREQIEEYQRFAQTLSIERMFELGIFQGGSVVFYEKLFRPRRLVALDLSKPIAALDDYLSHSQLTEVVKPYYQVDQSDRARLQQILDAEFPGQAMDLVIDDASHLLGPTRTSFNVLFPRVRPGGIYVIEDWGWEHWPGSWQTSESPFHSGTPALSTLIFELVMASASLPEVIASVKVSSNMVQVTRGPAELPDPFDISSSYLVRDWQEMIPLFAAAALKGPSPMRSTGG